MPPTRNPALGPVSEAVAKATHRRRVQFVDAPGRRHPTQLQPASTLNDNGGGGNSGGNSTSPADIDSEESIDSLANPSSSNISDTDVEIEYKLVFVAFVFFSFALLTFIVGMMPLVGMISH